ncbi:siderophore-interacting protein [Pseudactinotalea sp. HY158]|uniref:siderophore-interacting protein n=1 Tax=Pseudactinotalea sp. HY158 TaxID=2654547 RepID=UPI00129CDA4F|nr:siderophore-interacting protein [Pseudactinotalea sp. HY158]QGH68193.1 siderophore-interacting protein [Pseudactinotalea sp. HY158]
MSNISVTHAESGLVHTTVLRAERVTPNMIRVTFSGGDLAHLAYRGFDHWVRLAIPVHAGDRFDNLPERFGLGGYLRYLRLPKGTRPVIRNYTIRHFRGEAEELDIDFLDHGPGGVAGPWAASVRPGTEVALIDQGCGWQPRSASRSLIVADESGLPAALGILRDLPRDATGDALIELFDERDRQHVDAPAGMTVHWLTREPHAVPGAAALPALRALALPTDLYAFTVGESALATGARRHLVSERGVAKSHVTFSGYWRLGRAAHS